MLDVHPPHEPVHGLRDFLIHLGTIAIGLLIALGLEATVEWIHHRHEVAETREALHEELLENQRSFGQDTGYLRDEGALLKSNLAAFELLRTHREKSANVTVPAIRWSSSNIRMQMAAWKTAQQTGVTMYMPREEVMRVEELYGFFERMDKAHEEEADAISDAIGYMFEDPDPSHLTDAQLDREIEMTKRVLSKHLRHGFLMQNLAEEFPDFKPAPTREELERLMNQASGAGEL